MTIRKLDEGSILKLETVFDKSFIDFIRLIGLEHSERINRFKQISSTAVQQFTIRQPGLTIFDINGLQYKMKDMEPYLNSLVQNQMKAFSLDLINSCVFVDVTPVISDIKTNTGYIYIIVSVDKPITVNYPLTSISDVVYH